MMSYMLMLQVKEAIDYYEQGFRRPEFEQMYAELHLYIMFGVFFFW